MRKLSRKISLQFLLFVLAVLTVLVALLSVTFVRSDRRIQELSKLKEAIRLSVVYRLAQGYEGFVDGYSLEGVIDDGCDILIRLGDERKTILNRPAIPEGQLNEIEEAENGFKMLEGQLVYFSTVESNESRYVAGIVFDNEDVEELSAFLGQDGIAFLLIDDHFVIPREFSDSGLYVRTVLDEERWSSEIPSP